jgi:diguanylate cyclase (GGDEF)-like protein
VLASWSDPSTSLTSPRPAPAGPTPDPSSGGGSGDAGEAILDPAADPTADPTADLARSPELRLVRLRLVLTLAGTATLAAVAGLVGGALLGPNPIGTLTRAAAGAPLWALAAGAVLFALAADLTLWLARQIVRPAEELDRARRELHDLYRSARTSSLEDSLTGLGNHRAFQEEFGRLVEQCRRYRTSAALVLIDLDDFKLVNDGRGHAVGDAVLVEVARRLREGIRRTDRVFRIGGDEFALLLPFTEADDAAVVARRLLAACLEPRVGGNAIGAVSFSAGIAAAPAMGLDRDDLYEKADAALYEAKRAGRTEVRVFDPARSPRIAASPSAVRIAALDRAIRDRLLLPAYQPIVDLTDGRVVGFEAVTRPSAAAGFEDALGLFVTAEATGRTIDLDLACLETALGGAELLEPDQFLSLNVSPRTLEAPEFSATRLLRLLDRAGVEPARVVVELTERAAIADLDRVRAVVAACRSRGLRIAADDIGAGNAGLRLLSELRFDLVKIDLSLVQASGQSPGAVAVLRSLFDLARQWGALAVAEGVETPAQLALLRQIGIATAQGYLLGRPGPAPTLRRVDVASLLADRSPLDAALARRSAGVVAG